MKLRVSPAVWLLVLAAGGTALFQMRRDAAAGKPVAAVRALPRLVASPAAVSARPPAPHADRDPLPDGAVDMFKVVNFAPPPPPPPPPQVVAVPAPAPVAQPFPYRYFGRMTGPDGKQLVYLARDDTLVAVRQGEELDGGYRVDAVGDTDIVITHTPLGERTVLTIRSAE